MPDTIERKTGVTRVEVIDHRNNTSTPGRAFVAKEVSYVMVSMQDDGRTMKIFISDVPRNG